MTIIYLIDKYVQVAELGRPIYTKDIYEYVKRMIPNLDKATFNMNMKRYESGSPEFVRYQKGIYYKTVETPFGRTGINTIELIKRKYIEDGNDIYGYESGPSYMNKIGLTTQIPNLTYIVTEKTRYNSKKEEEKIFLLKPIIDINKDNYKYLQFLDILDNKLNTKIEVDNYEDKLRSIIDKDKLNFEYLVGYAKYYKSSRVYQGLSSLVRI